jgi:hypothetical protein
MHSQLCIDPEGTEARPAVEYCRRQRDKDAHQGNEAYARPPNPGSKRRNYQPYASCKRTNEKSSGCQAYLPSSVSDSEGKGKCIERGKKSAAEKQQGMDQRNDLAFQIHTASCFDLSMFWGMERTERMTSLCSHNTEAAQVVVTPSVLQTLALVVSS